MTLQICSAKNCTCVHHQILENLEKRKNGKVKSLLKRVDNFHSITDSSGQTFLHYAAKLGNAEIIKYLISKECNINAYDNFGHTALLAVLNDTSKVEINAKMAKVLLKKDADLYKPPIIVEIVLRNIIFSSFVSKKHNYYPIIQIMFDKINADFSSDKREKVISLLNTDNSAKLIAVVFGNSMLTKFVLDNNYPLNFKEPSAGCTALHYAIVCGRLDKAKILINQGADVGVLNNMDNIPLCYYLDNCQEVDEDFEMLKKLLRLSVNCGHEAVVHLVSRGKKQTVEAILQSDVDLTKCFKDKSLVSLLLLNTNLDVLDLLGEIGLDPWIETIKNTKLALVDALKSKGITEIKTNVIIALLALLVVIHNLLLTAIMRSKLSDINKQRFDLCIQQLKEMKDSEIFNKITLFEFLIQKDEKKLANYVRNQDFIVAIESKMKCPMEKYYLKILQTRVRKGLDRIELDKKAALAFEVLTGLHSDVAFEIIKHLSPTDLKNLCRTENLVTIFE